MGTNAKAQDPDRRCSGPPRGQPSTQWARSNVGFAVGWGKGKLKDVLAFLGV